MTHTDYTGADYKGENLIFIISQPRSGSTLLQRVLAGNPDIQTSAETWLMLHPTYAHKHTEINAVYNTMWAANGVKAFLENYTDGMDVYDNAIRAWANTIYSNALQQENKKYFLDKTPRYFFIIPDLYRLFPDAKFIFLIRNPLAVLASELKTYIKGNWRKLGQFKQDLVDAPGLLLDGIQLLGENAITINYEAFVSNPNENIKLLCKNIGIDFHENMIDYSNTPAPKGKMNDPVGIHQHTKPSNTSINKWTKMVDIEQEHYFACRYLEVLGPTVFEKLGYSYEETKTKLNYKPSSEFSKSLFPWDIAMIPKEQWNFIENVRAQRYFDIQEKGMFRGRISALRKTYKRLKKIVKHQLTTQNKTTDS